MVWRKGGRKEGNRDKDEDKFKMYAQKEEKSKIYMICLIRESERKV